MSKDKVRMGQIVGLFGPGSMMDLPDRSVLVMGLDDWEAFGKEPFKTIEEPRLAALLERRLSEDGDRRLAPEKRLSFRTPPIDTNDPGLRSPAIKARVFPQWFACDAIGGDAPNRRRVVRFSELDPPKRLEHKGDDGKKRRATPLRFVCGCERGHLQDIDWRRVVHSGRFGEQEGEGRACGQALWLEDSGTSADPRDTRIACECGASLSLEELFQPRRLGSCTGERPWIGTNDPDGCTESLRLLTRSATNTYFPQIVRVISLPEASDKLDEAIATIWSNIGWCKTAENIAVAKLSNPVVASNLAGYTDTEVIARILSNPPGSTEVGEAQPQNPKIAEYAMFASGRPLIGENTPKAKLHAETLDRTVWDPTGDPLLSGIASLVAVHRLREVACLYGFTRFEPAPVADDEIEDVGLAVNGAPLAASPEWLPAIEQFGEGFFIRFAPEKLALWAASPSVRERWNTLRGGVTAWTESRRERGASANIPREGESVEFVMAHSLSHALMTEVAIDCGYPASSLKERIYFLPLVPGQPPECGILIYTASSGNQGTLGGLVEVTHRFDTVLKNALERLHLCSGDPICADHDPSNAMEDRALHGAACHGCLLISETSCEMRNVFLDRGLLVEMITGSNFAYF